MYSATKARDLSTKPKIAFSVTISDLDTHATVFGQDPPILDRSGHYQDQIVQQPLESPVKPVLLVLQAAKKHYRFVVDSRTYRLASHSTRKDDSEPGYNPW